MRPSTRRWRPWMILLLPFALVVVGWVFIFSDGPKKDRAMRAKFGEIRPGMTLEEVESLMGRPFDGQSARESGIHVKGWDGPGTLTINVLLDDQNIVVDKELEPTRWRPTAWSEMRYYLDRWLGL